MKVNYVGEQLKAAIDRALGVVTKKNPMYVLSAIKIKAENNALYVIATDSLKSYVSIKVDDAKVDEPGCVYIHKDDIKKVYTISGYVTAMTELNKSTCTFTVSNGKKKSAIKVPLYNDNDLKLPSMDNVQLVAKDKENSFLNVLLNLAPFRGTDGDRVPLMAAYNFNGKAKRVEALDGHRIAIKHMDDFFTSDDFCFVLRGTAFEHLKKIVNSKSNGEVEIRLTDEYVFISGADYTYISKLIEGNYYNISDIMKMDANMEFTVDSKELELYAKEYKSLIGSNKSPMRFEYDSNTNELYTGVKIGEFITADVISSFNPETLLNINYRSGFNPVFVMEAMKLLNGKVKCSVQYTGKGCQKSPMLLTNDDSEYEALILPVNINNNNGESENLLREFMAA